MKYAAGGVKRTPAARLGSFESYGKTEKGVIKTFIDYDKYVGKFDTFDLAYLYGATPDGETKNGKNANYKITTCIPQNTKILVYFAKLTKKQGE